MARTPTVSLLVVALLAAALPGRVRAQDEDVAGLDENTSSPTGTAAAPPRPKNFPAIKLAKGANPLYCQVKLDSLSDRVAYILFDGSVTNGYKKMYVWSPGHDDFDEPKPLLHDDQTETYRQFKSESIVGDVASITTWTIRYRAEMHGYSRRNYRTGEMITRAKRLLPRFYFNVDLMRGPARRADRKAGKYPVDIGMRGKLAVSDSWEDMPAVLAPWERTYCSMSRRPVYESDDGYLRCKAHLRFHLSRSNTYPVTIRNLPENAKVRIEIAPYLRDTIYERNFTMQEIFMNHYDVRIPYGWYRMDWAFESDFFGAQSLGGNGDSRPFAFSPPPPD